MADYMNEVEGRSLGGGMGFAFIRVLLKYSGNSGNSGNSGRVSRLLQE